jgi:hypothetical protein
MRIIEPTETIDVPRPVFFIYGDPGIGKTTLAYSVEDPLLLDFDLGAHRAKNRRHTAVIESWSDVDGLRDALGPFRSVVVDTAGRCIDRLIDDIIATDEKKARDGTLTQQGWGKLKQRFRLWMGQLQGMGKDVLLLGHVKEEKDGETRILRPDIVGGSYAEVMKLADFVGYMYKSGTKRMLDFEPTDRYVGKNPAGWKPLVVPPVDKSQHFMADLYQAGREALGRLSAESAAMMIEVDGHRSAISALDSPESATAYVETASAVEHPSVKAQVKKLLYDHTKSRGWMFDVGAKRFVAAEAVEGAGA